MFVVAWLLTTVKSEIECARKLQSANHANQDSKTSPASQHDLDGPVQVQLDLLSIAPFLKVAFSRNILGGTLCGFHTVKGKLLHV
jgi:hypothetical protein